MTISIGDVFARLTVVGFSVQNNRPACVCMCICGRETVTRASHLPSGRTRSCGCLKKTNDQNKTHGESHKAAEWFTWTNMRARCNIPSHASYARYGGRGIAVCERWNVYEHFLADMGRRPSRAHSIDRINNARDYEPSNCRWATRTEQARNKRNNRRITIGDKTATLVEWLAEKGMYYKMFAGRVARGMSEAEALLLPIDIHASTHPTKHL